MTNRDMKNYRSLDPHWTKKPGITILIIIFIILILAALDNRDRAHIQEMIIERDQYINELQLELIEQQRGIESLPRASKIILARVGTQAR